MKLTEAKDAIRNKTIIDYKLPDDDKWRWMIITSLSYDETGVYYKRNGCGLLYGFLMLEDIILI